VAIFSGRILPAFEGCFVEKNVRQFQLFVGCKSLADSRKNLLVLTIQDISDTAHPESFYGF
jgi:hypothetical protein